MRMNSNISAKHNSSLHQSSNSNSSSKSNSKVNLSSKLLAANGKLSENNKTTGGETGESTSRAEEEESKLTQNETTTPSVESLPAQLDCPRSEPDDKSRNGDTKKASSPSSINTRSLKLSKLRPDISLTDILELISLGPIETCHYDLTDDPSTNQPPSSSSSPSLVYRSVIISFMDSFTANECYIQLADILGEMKHLLDSPDLTLSPIESQPLSDYIQNEINNNGASRALCLSNLPYNLSERILLTELSKFGTLQSVEYNVDKNAAFVYFTSIFNAIKCFDQLPLSNSLLSDSKIFYSNDGNSVNVPTFSASNSFLDTFAENNEIELFTEHNGNNLTSYSRTTTSLSSPRVSTDFTTCTTESNGGPSYRESRNPDYIGTSGNNRVNRVFKGSLDDPSTLIEGINETNNQIGHVPNDIDVDPDVANIPNHSTSSTVLDNSGFFQEGYTPVVMHDYLSQPYRPHQIYDNQPVYMLEETPLNTPLLQNNIGNRTVYLGGLPGGTTSEDICNKVRGGILENIKLLPDKKAAFLTFIYHHDAADFIARTFKDNLFIKSKCVRVGWGRNSGNLNPEIQLAVDSGACRNLYIGVNEDLEDESDYNLIPVEAKDKTKTKENAKSQFLSSGSLPEESDDVSETKNEDLSDDKNEDNSTGLKKVYHAIPDEDTLRRDFSIFGEIEQINYFKNGSCAFINFTNILSCIKAIEEFQSEDSSKLHNSFDNRYAKFKIFYGKDRCGNPPKKKRSKRSNNKSRVNAGGTTSKFGYALDSNQSIDTDLALKFDSAFTGMGISSPSASKKVREYRDLSDQNKHNQANVVDSDIDYDSVSDTDKLKVDTYTAEVNVNNDYDNGNSDPAFNEKSEFPEIEAEDEDKDEEDADIITETLNTSLNSSAGDSKTINNFQKRNPRGRRGDSLSNRSRLYSSSRSSSMTSFHNYPNNNSYSHSFSYNQDNYSTETPSYVLTPPVYYYPSQNSNSSQFPVSVPHTPMKSYGMNYYLNQGGPPPHGYYYYPALQQPQQHSRQQPLTPVLHQQHNQYLNTKSNYKRYQQQRQYQNKNSKRTNVPDKNDSSSEFTYAIESTTPNCKE